MTENPFDPAVSKFSVLFTRAVFTWNEIEDTARTLLRNLSGESVGVWVAVLHLNNIALQDALRAIVEFSPDGRTAAEQSPIANHVRDHVLHFVTGMDVLRVHRNFYVHSIKGFGKNAHDPAIFQGTLYSQDAKGGRLASIYEAVTTDELGQFLKSAMECARYGRNIQRQIEKPGALHAFLYSDPPEPLDSLEKPVWPPLPKKERRYWSEGRFS